MGKPVHYIMNPGNSRTHHNARLLALSHKKYEMCLHILSDVDVALLYFTLRLPFLVLPIEMITQFAFLQYSIKT